MDGGGGWEYKLLSIPIRRVLLLEICVGFVLTDRLDGDLLLSLTVSISGKELFHVAHEFQK